jgi:hypothetical protein
VTERCPDCGEPVAAGDTVCAWHRSRHDGVLKLIAERGLVCRCADGPRKLIGHHTVGVCPIGDLAMDLIDSGFYVTPEERAAEAAEERAQFVTWFDSLTPQERVEVWCECDAMTAAEYRERFEENQKALAAARKCIEAADEMRSWYRKQMDPDGPEVDYDAARAELARVMGTDAGGEKR